MHPGFSLSEAAPLLRRVISEAFDALQTPTPHAWLQSWRLAEHRGLLVPAHP